jgi:hypothetical protein
MATYWVTVSRLEAEDDGVARKWTASDWGFYLEATDEQAARGLASGILEDFEGDIIKSIELKKRERWVTR